MELTQAQIDERIAVLKRFKSLLEQQRNKFREYLHVLECQQNKIELDDGDALVAHAELEQQVVAGIRNLQKVIVPMSEMYKASVKGTQPEADQSVENIQLELERLQGKVLEQNQKNRELLRAHLVQIRAQLDNFKNPYRNNRSVYAAKAAQGSLVAVEV